MQKKSTLNVSSKKTVAKHAGGLVRDGDCVFIDGGTTMIPLMDSMLLKPVKIVTYNAMIVQPVANSIAEIFVVGGKYLPHYSMFVGASAQDMLKQFRFNIAFFGCAGVDLEEGYAYTTEMESLLMKKTALEHAENSYLLLDDSKLKKQGFLQFARLENFTGMICNKPKTQANESENMIWVS